MVGDVEELCAELRVYCLTELHILEDGEIEVPISRADHNVSPCVAEGERLVVNKGRGVEPLLYRVRTGIGIAHQVGPVVAKPSSTQSLARQHREGLPG